MTERQNTSWPDSNQHISDLYFDGGHALMTILRATAPTHTKHTPCIEIGIYSFLRDTLLWHSHDWEMDWKWATANGMVPGASGGKQYRHYWTDVRLAKRRPGAWRGDM